MGWAGQGANSPTAELGQGRVRGDSLDSGTSLESMLACDGELEELKDGQ